ncbi:MAG: phosphoribosyltransferase [Candidatus Yanofskybacteria bacterium]|nr:phosphoribosyltransferase [Candidatus Yanofskybacteria bacterium]
MPEKFSTIKPEQAKGEIQLEKVAELEVPMRKILEQMLESLEKGEYDLIIGIDASGRIPTLIVDKFVSRVYQNKGYELPIFRFIAGSIRKEDAVSKVKEWNPHRRVLIVEDTINTGDSVRSLSKALGESGISFDVIAVGTLLPRRIFDKKRIERLTKDLGAKNIYVGSEEAPRIYGQKHISGVQKEVGDIFSRPHKRVRAEQQIKTLGKELVDELGHSISSVIQEEVNQARADANIVADRLVDWYESQKQENEK